jgi:hypothetical protein
LIVCQHVNLVIVSALSLFHCSPSPPVLNIL